jgi:endonuclease YncB( thermonuclease family)
MQNLLHWYAAKLVRVIDGDTVRLAVDVGFGFSFENTFRLAKINCPELPTEGGIKAKEYAKAWFTQRGGVCIIRSIKLDKYGRYLAHICNAKEIAESLNCALIDAGLAVPFMVTSDN